MQHSFPLFSGRNRGCAEFDAGVSFRAKTGGDWWVVWALNQQNP